MTGVMLTTSMSNTKTGVKMNLPIDKTETDIDSLLGTPHKCILYNDEEHSTVEVAIQIQLAINCDPAKAYEIMLEAHNTGSAIVWSGGKERCEQVSSVLERIGLATKVEKE